MVGTGLLVSGFIVRMKFKKSIQSVGDLNNDGKINEEDLIIYGNQLDEAKKEEKRRIESKKYCKYCGSKLADENLFCPQCGAARKQD